MHNTAWDEIDSIHKQLLYSLYTIVTGMHWVFTIFVSALLLSKILLRNWENLLFYKSLMFFINQNTNKNLFNETKTYLGT